MDTGINMALIQGSMPKRTMLTTDVDNTPSVFLSRILFLIISYVK